MAFYRGDGGAGTGNIEVQPIAIGVGGTGATTSAQARTNLGLGTAAISNTGDFATAAQGALADSAVQPADIGTAAAEDVGYFATAAQGLLADSAVQPGDLAAVATSGDYDDLSNKPSLFSGDYDDLTNKPTLVTALDGLSDVTITSATNGQTLQYNGSAWVNTTAGTGTVTSIAATVPTGLTVSGSPITSSGTLAISYDTGYAIPTTAKQTEWDTAYGWGNHASAGYLTTETYTGTVTSVALTVPTGLTVSGSPVTSSGTLAVSFDTGYSIPTTSSQSNWDTAYGWGNHASAGYLTSETYTGTVTSVAATVPTGLVVSGSPITSSGTLAFSFDTGYSIPTTSSQSNWDTAYGWGNHASAGYLTSYTETDPVVGAINGLVKANGSGTISAAVADTDYLTPSSVISGGTY